MIKPGFKVKVSFPKYSKSGKLMFGIRDYEASKKEEKNYITVMPNQDIPLKGMDEVIIGTISGIKLGRNDKNELTVLMFCDISKPDQAATQATGAVPYQQPDNEPVFAQTSDAPGAFITTDDFNTGPLLDIDSDDLTF